MDPFALIARFYPPGTLARRALLGHSIRVARLAVAVARRVAGTTPVDTAFVEEAALLHDIGMLHTDAPEIGCFGPFPYLAHAPKGREMLDALGLPRHGLVCERHIGVGLSAEEIIAAELPLPRRDLCPVTLEEQIVTYADLFYSKSPAKADRPRDPATVRRTLERFGPGKVAIFDAWHARFTA